MTTYNIERRIQKLEVRMNTGKEGRTAMLLRLLHEHGYEAIARVFNDSEAWTPKPFDFLMNVMDDTDDPFVFERYRGLVPDDVIRQAYNLRRNWGGDEVRRRAGVIDSEGKVMPGYRLADNGCILDAETIAA